MTRGELLTVLAPSKAVGRQPKSSVGRNCLITGPAGSGKLSLVRAFTAALYPRARQFLLDWEVEPSVQQDQLDQLRIRGSNPRRQEIWILRRLDRASPACLSSALSVCRDACTASDRPGQVIFATALDTDVIQVQVNASALFPWRVSLAGLPRDRRALERVTLEILAELDQQYGRRISTLDSAVVDLLLRHRWVAHFRELVNIVERAYFREPTASLTVRTFENLGLDRLASQRAH